MMSAARRLFHSIASLKVAIPLVVITVTVTIVGSLQPDTGYYRTWWYLGLLGLNGLSLLFITILHIPLILARKGRNALIGVVLTHLGILILIGGIIYGGMSDSRYDIKIIEGEMTIVPGLPFVVHLDELMIEEYPPESVAHLDAKIVPKKRQESYLTLYKEGNPWFKAAAAPGAPARIDGFTLLPSLNDIGWYFELIITDPQNRKKNIPVRPWAPPMINVGTTPIMAHSVIEAGEMSAQVFTIVNGQMKQVGWVTKMQALEINGYTVSLGAVKRYTGLLIYNRPHGPILVAGCLAMLFGLLWHYYHRYRDQKRDKQAGIQHV